MLDILHYFFELDAIGEEEVQKAKQSLRRAIYIELYGRTYTWGDVTASAGEWGTKVGPGGGADLGPGLTHKGYTPPTPMRGDASRPFGALLDAPVG